VEPLVTLKNAGIERAGRWLVRGVDLRVRPSEIVTLIGPNGSGKSTTARMVLGIEALTEGAAENKTGLISAYVPQKLAIDWTMPLRVIDFMQLTGRMARGDIESALERAGIGTFMQRDMRTLSGGEQQRVMLARALARKPQLLVLDEPLQGVDFAGEIALYDLIKSFRDETGCGILLISHDLHMVMAATDHVVCLNGHVCCHGTPDSVANNAEYKRLFGDRAAGLALYHHHHDHTHLADGRVLHGDGSVTDHCHPGDGHHHGAPAVDDTSPYKGFRHAG
jgi:zinc transport system ATP-binding protein